VAARPTGQRRRIRVLVTPFEGADYLVELAGESEWVRNVRAAKGRATLRRRGTRPVTPVERPIGKRAPVLAVYQAAGAARSGDEGADLQARYNFGLEPERTMADFERISPRYPVFRVVRRTEER
jgi:hypothetical protein